jgi:hypothetical protein
MICECLCVNFLGCQATTTRLQYYVLHLANVNADFQHCVFNNHSVYLLFEGYGMFRFSDCIVDSNSNLVFGASSTRIVKGTTAPYDRGVSVAICLIRADADDGIGRVG